MYINDLPESGLFAGPFDIASNALSHNAPTSPADFYECPGKYAFNVDAYEWVPNPVYDPSVELLAVRARKVAAVKSEATAAINAVWPNYKQRNAALGITGHDTAACKAFIEGWLARVAAAKSAIVGATTVEEINAVQL